MHLRATYSGSDAAGAPIERVAQQLLAGPVEADKWVANWLVANVNTIAGRSPAVAVELLNHAVQNGNRREELLIELVRLHFWLGRRPEAEARAVLAMTADPDHAAEMRLMLEYFGQNRDALIDGSGELEPPG